MDDKQIIDLLSEFDNFPIDRCSIPQNRLDLANRQRTSLFPWRGQFSPELIELLLSEYTSSDCVVGDPFVGSGTALFESARNSLSCFGAEIHPAATVMASTVHFVNLDAQERRRCISFAQKIVEKHLPIHYLGGLFSLLEEQKVDNRLSLQDALRAILREASEEPFVHNIVANTIIRFMASREERDSEKLFQAFKEHKTIIEELPYSKRPCKVFHCDARALSLESSSVDFIVTSPPYINVFNYHQNYRAAMELMGWNMLRVATSEIGSNRKNRGNRFLTVVQYAVDMLAALLEMRRIIRPNGRLIIVVGRESKVRGVSFENGLIIAILAIGGANFRLELRQERKFKTRFGETIYEDILHLVPATQTLYPPDDFARLLAQHVLYQAMGKATDTVRGDIVSAIQQASMVRASPYFKYQAVAKERSYCQPLTLTS